MEQDIKKVYLNDMSRGVDFTLVTFRFAVLVGMLILIVVGGLMAYQDHRQNSAPVASNSAGALTVNMASGATLKNGILLSGTYRSPQAVTIYYVVTTANNEVAGAGVVELDSRSRFAKNLSIHPKESGVSEGTLRVYSQTQSGEKKDILELPIRVEAEA